jgi:DNA-directed RNA polymerase subunit RPC12/RpoP
MARPELKGHIGPCTCCGHDDMEVRDDKNGNPYAWCPMCSAQVLTHGRPERVLPMLKRMRACNCSGSVTVTEGKGEGTASGSVTVREGKTVATAPAVPAKPTVAAAAPAAPPKPASGAAKPEPLRKTSSWAVLLDRDEVTA